MQKFSPLRVYPYTVYELYHLCVQKDGITTLSLTMRYV